LYWWQGPSAAGVATSARELVAVAGCGPDQRALGVQSLLGWQLGNATPFAGIRKVPAGHYARLHHGRVKVLRYDTGHPASGGAAEMAALLRTWVEEYLDTHDDPVLQLTGGHDSRILLGAIPASRRADVRALTLDAPGGLDAPIARALAARYGMGHEVFDTGSLADLDPAEGYALAVAAARGLDCCANPLALAPLSAAENRLPQGRRLSGLGGEVARGFYYGAQPSGMTSPRLAERFARWRLFTNEAVDPAALSPGFAAAAREHTLALITELLTGYSRHWLRSLDEFYLWQRMQRWAGAHGTVAAVDRSFCNPMFDREFAELARAASPEDKRDSRLLGRIMRELDPELAAIPLDSGRTPNQLAAGRGTWAASAHKAVRKVAQRVTGSRRAPLGAPLLASLVVSHWRTDPSLLDGLPDLVRPSYVSELVDGRRPGDPATVAFLLNLTQAAQRASTHPATYISAVRADLSGG
jgi:asparagine synthase (glutamine-hydrolysing)